MIKHKYPIEKLGVQLYFRKLNVDLGIKLNLKEFNISEIKIADCGESWPVLKLLIFGTCHDDGLSNQMMASQIRLGSKFLVVNGVVF